MPTAKHNNKISAAGSATVSPTVAPTVSPTVSPTLAARDFIQRWGPGGPSHGLTERAGAQAHFIDLCRVLGVPEPGQADRYTFEKGLNRTGSGGQHTNGFADVWLNGRLRVEVHTHFTGTPSECRVFALHDITRPEVQRQLRALWSSPESFKPKRSNREITEQAASTFAAAADRLRAAGVPAAQTSHFLTQCLFCFFSEDVGLRPDKLFERLVGVNVTPERLRLQLQALLNTMQSGGLFGVDDIAWFNGGLFKTVAVPPLAAADVAALKAASALDWSAIDASVRTARLASRCCCPVRPILLRHPAQPFP